MILGLTDAFNNNAVYLKNMEKRMSNNTNEIL